MRELGRLKVRKLCLSASVELMLGDALDLPFDNSTFQGIVSGFCLRNITDRKKAFAEMYRTLAVAGRLVILELGVPNNALLRLFHGIHGRCIVPVAARLAGLSNAYNYLMDSIDEFAAPSKVVEEIQAAGFSDASFRPLSGGIVNLFIGEKG
jgi:demethylmenaquinone methyltransferase/2-methoxy-6-polyprenyl-1,4-benzoquinol methylase